MTQMPPDITEMMYLLASPKFYALFKATVGLTGKVDRRRIKREQNKALKRLAKARRK